MVKNETIEELINRYEQLLGQIDGGTPEWHVYVRVIEDLQGLLK